MGLNLPKEKKTQKETFDEHFPYYLLIGMTADQYWDGDCLLTIHYRKKDKLEQDRINERLWMQGLYFYDALTRVAPVLRPFAKNAKLEPYLEKPYGRTIEEINLSEEQKIENVKTRQAAFLQGWANRANAKIRKKENGKQN